MKTANEDRSSSAGQGRILAGGRKKGLIFWRERSLPPAFFIVFQKKRPPIENQNNQNSIRTGSFLLSVCCSFFVVSTFPSVACFRCRQPSLYRRERGKVFGLNTLCLQRKILPETARPPDLFTFNEVCTNFMDGEEAGGCEMVIGCQSRNVCGSGFSFPSVCPFPLKFFPPLSWHIPVWWKYWSVPSSWLCSRWIRSLK